MKIEALTVCRDYADFLAWTLPGNCHQFNRMVVVTSPEDEATQRVCEAHRVTCITTDAVNRGTFNKAAAINVGLRHLDMDGWVVHLDADIALPPTARRALESNLQLDPTMIYGIDRHLFRSAKAWRKHLLLPKEMHSKDVFVHAEHYPVATRFYLPPEGGYVPIGFFQMWNPRISGIYSYPETHTGAARTDTAFAVQWPRTKRHLLPEIIGYHLESEEAEHGTNWEGRRTRPFDPGHKAWYAVRREHKHHAHPSYDPDTAPTPRRMPTPKIVLRFAALLIVLAALCGLVTANIMIVQGAANLVAVVASIGACLAIDGVIMGALGILSEYVEGML